MKPTRILLIAAIVLGLALGPAGVAEATSCAYGEPNAAALLRGTAPRLEGESLFDRYDLVVVGTVTSVDTRRSLRAPGGRTQTRLDVAAGFGVTEIGDAFVVASDDPGQLNGYGYQRGRTYFIPIKAEGPQGQRNYSFACDPIVRLDGQANVQHLIRVAHRNDIPVAVPDDGPATAVGVASPSPDGGSATGPVLIGLGVAAAAGLSLATGVRRRRRTSPRAA